MNQEITQYVGFDLETTGVDPFTDLPVSYGFVISVQDGATRQTRALEAYVHPGVPIPQGATDVHHITDEMVQGALALAPSLTTVATLLSTLWAEGSVLVGMNVAYDLTMVNAAATNQGLPSLAERGPIGPVLDVLILDRHFDKYRKGKRTLISLCEHYGVTLSDAHSATADAAACLDILEVMKQKYPAIKALAPQDINTTLYRWHYEWLSNFSDYQVKRGNPPIGPGQYGWPIHTTDEDAPPPSPTDATTLLDLSGDELTLTLGSDLTSMNFDAMYVALMAICSKDPADPRITSATSATEVTTQSAAELVVTAFEAMRKNLGNPNENGSLYRRYNDDGVITYRLWRNVDPNAPAPGDLLQQTALVLSFPEVYAVSGLKKAHPRTITS
jgi:DNA polymerase-3 subunit epsilon